MNIDLLRVAGDLSAHLVPLGTNLFLQSTLLIATGLLVAHLFRRRGPALQSTILRATLVATIACPLASLLFELAGVEGSKLSLPHPGAVAAPTHIPDATAAATAPGAALPVTGGLATAQPASSVRPNSRQAGPATNGPTSNISAKISSGEATTLPATTSPAAAPRDEWSALALAYATLAGLWLVGAGFFLTRLTVCHQRIARMRRESDLPEVAVFESCGGIARELAIPSPEVRLHRELKSPLLVGLFRPAILLPDVKDLASLVASREVLVHELAHRVRGDCFWHLLSHVTTALLWYQPLLWMLTRRIEESGEEVCDNYVIARAPDRQAYAHQLVELAEHLQYSAAEALAGTGVIAFRSALGRRVVRILDASRNLSLRIGTRAATTVAVTAALATSAVGLIGVSLRADGETGPGLAIRQLPLTVEEGIAVSPDGRLIAFKPKENNNVVIHELPTGKNWTAIKRGKGQSGKERGEGQGGKVVFSPDGRLIAYERPAPVDETEAPWRTRVICIAGIDGAEAKQVYEGDKDSSLRVLEWSRDGGRLIVGSSEIRDGSVLVRSSSIGTLDVKAGTLREIIRWKTYTRFYEEHLAASGRYLAYRAGGKPENQRWISILDLETGTRTTVVKNEAGALVGWAPGDAKLLFLSQRTGTLGLWTINVRDGKPAGEPELAKANLGNISPIGLTRNGSLYYTDERPNKNVFLATANFQTGEILGQPRRATDRFLGEQAMPVWSKDGQRLMFAGGGGQKRFVSVPMAAGAQKEFAVGETFTTPLLMYAWSPDSAFLLVHSTTAVGDLGIHRYELAAGTTERLVKRNVPHWLCHPRFSLDGNSFYFMRRDFVDGFAADTDYKDSIVRRNLRSSQEEIVYASPDKLQPRWPYELSPDGERLAVITWDQFSTKDTVFTLKVRSVNGSTSKEVVRMAPRENVNSLAWTPDGKRLVYSKQLSGSNEGADGPTEVWSTAVDSGQSVELKFAPPNIREISIHPDGRQIAFSAGASSDRDLWVMEGLMLKPVTSKARTANK